MRHCASTLVPFLASLFFCPAFASAEEIDDLIVIHRYRDIRNLEQFELERYERIDLPMRIQELQDAIKLTQAKRASLRRGIAEYERFKTNAFFLTLENLRLELMSTQQQLKHLQREKLLLQYYGVEEIRLRKQQLYHKASHTTIY